MKMIVESGATKSNWVVLNDQQLVHKQQLPGINVTSNPSSLNIIDSLDTDGLGEISHIYFYGAGLGHETSRQKLKSKLASHFKSSEIFIDTDILAAARSSSNASPSIVSILGTGMNTIVFDGQDIIHKTPSLGYLIFDSGSGFHIGQQIIKAYFQNDMKASDKALLESDFFPKGQELIPYLYAAAKPNFEVARFSKFLNSCETSFRTNILAKCFDDFFEQQILPLETFKNYKLNFVGSIAHAFKDELRNSAQRHGREILNITADPLEGLIEYHKLN